MTERRIVCAACRDADGQIITSARHFDLLMHRTIQSLRESQKPWEQGFIDQKGVFLSREEAYVIAHAAGQIIRRCGGDEGRLYSENLY